ncbi:MAG: septum formation initiator family protein [Microbacteriaceae bacterium]|nr:septum formation initiator family protein [Microbacteriaceae bacterium]
MAKRPVTRVRVADARELVSTWASSLHMSGATLLCLALVVFGVVVLANPLRTLIEQRAQVADLQAQLDQKNATLDALTTQRARWNDPAYIRAQARDRLFYVMPGETSYLVINDVTDEKDRVRTVSADLTHTDVDWVRGLLTSVVVAGLSEPTPAQMDAVTGEK